MILVEDINSTDITMSSDPILTRGNKRGTDNLLLKLPSPKKSHFLGSFVIVDNTEYEIVDAKGSFCKLKSVDKAVTFECSKLELSPSGKYQRFQKSQVLIQPSISNLSLKNPYFAASCLLKKPMLFCSSKEINFVVNYTGEALNIYDFTLKSLSDNLLFWDVQLHRCLVAAPELPIDFNGDLIVLAVLSQEGIVLIGSTRDMSFGYSSDFSGDGLIFYTNRSTQGRGKILFLEIAHRIQNARQKRDHYFSANDVGLISCFYFDKHSLLTPKAIALPLTMAKNSELITNSRSQNKFCLRLLKEMNGAVLASPTVSKKAKRIENSLTSPQVSTKTMFLLTPAERLILLFRLKDGAASS
jgi:hypothetical protein